MPENKKTKLKNYDRIVTERLKSGRLKHQQKLKAKSRSTALNLICIQKHAKGFTAKWKERLYSIITLLSRKLTNNFIYCKRYSCFLEAFPSLLSAEDLVFLEELHKIKSPGLRKQLVSLIKIISAEEKMQQNSTINKILDSYLKNISENNQL